MKRKHKKRTKKLQKLNRLHDIVWNFMSRYVRLRDFERGCITCGKKVSYNEFQAGHFVHVNSLDYDEKNINGQCSGCNCYKHGDLGQYAVNLDRKWGIFTADSLLAKRHIIKKFNREELETIKQDLINKIALIMSGKVSER